jgi:hypothetical protein
MSHPSTRRPQLTELRALRTVLYVIAGVSAVLILVRYVLWIPGAVDPRTEAFERVVMFIRNRLDLPMLVMVFVLSLVGLVASCRQDPPA